MSLKCVKKPDNLVRSPTETGKLYKLHNGNRTYNLAVMYDDGEQHRKVALPLIVIIIIYNTQMLSVYQSIGQSIYSKSTNEISHLCSYYRTFTDCFDHKPIAL